MKILKKLLLIGLLSFAFIVNVSATNYSNYSSELKYDETVQEKINENKERYNNLIDYISNSMNITRCSIENKECLVNIDMSTIDSDTWVVTFDNLLSDNDYPYIRSYYMNGYPNWKSVVMYFWYTSYKVTFDSSNLVTGYSLYQFNQHSYGFNYGDLKPLEEDVILPISTYYFITDFINDELSIPFKNYNYNEFTYQIPLKINDTIYTPVTTINAFEFFENFLNISNNFKEIDLYENSEVITYKIKDEEVGQDKELKIKFTFDNQLDITSDDIEVFKYGSQVSTFYNMNCSNIETSSVCEFDLKYDVYESIDDKLMFDFKFNNSYNVKIEDTSGSNGVYSNYKDVEYEYKQINFKEKSGAVFYLRNYDNFEYLSSYYEEGYFKFIIMSDLDIFGRDVIYPNDIEYKNTYIYKNNDSYMYSLDSYIKLNNFSRVEVPYIFDCSILKDNKYSSFVIRNRNYLGQLDTNNKNLYVYYNSSLFNINEIKYSQIVNNDGSVNNIWSTSNDFDFTYNGKQESISSNINNYEIGEFDEDIKVSYNSGLEYFKDKIINMFELVSEFYNNMPEKFRVSFSLIFVLFVGIYLYRLLL